MVGYWVAAAVRRHDLDRARTLPWPSWPASHSPTPVADFSEISLIEVVFGNEGDDLMTLVASSECGMRSNERDSKKKQRERRRLVANQSSISHEARQARPDSGHLFFTLPTRVPQRHMPRMRAAISTRTPLLAALGANTGSGSGHAILSKSSSSSFGMKRVRVA
jgi:hypothetical protein